MQDMPDPTLNAAAASETTAIPEEGVPAMFCTQCGTRNGSAAKFCKQCGHKLERTGPLRISEEEFKLPESRDERVRALMLLAYQKYEASDLDGAVALCVEAVEVRPESTDAHSLLSTLYEKKGDRQNAIAERERVLELNPGSIADREKLDELKDGKSSFTPRKIISSHRKPDNVLIESPVAQAFAAVFVMIIVMVIGVGMMWAGRSGKSNTANAANPTSGIPNRQFASSGGQTQMAQAPTGFNDAGQQGAGQGQGNLQNYSQNPTTPFGQNSPAPLNSGTRQPVVQNDASSLRRPANVREAGSPLLTRQLGPAPVSPNIDSQGGRLGTAALPDRGTVILPDTGPDTQPGITAPTISQPPPVTSRTSNPPQGKIEIIVSPGPGSTGSRAGEGSRGSGGEATGTLDSRSALEVARDLHNKGQYSKAVNSYKQALDGAGDGAADIHQKIGLCYYRLGDKESAITHYQQAIESFKNQMAAGRNVESAKNGIRACENGIKVCQ